VTAIPNIRVVIGACLVAVIGYLVFSVYAVMWLRDATMTGCIRFLARLVVGRQG
jgi:hypothetical protein